MKEVFIITRVWAIYKIYEQISRLQNLTEVIISPGAKSALLSKSVMVKLLSLTSLFKGLRFHITVKCWKY